MKANANGFIGCLSAVQFNNIFPLKIAFQNNHSSQVMIKGQVTESSCGSLNGEDATSGETTHSFAGTMTIYKVNVVCRILTLLSMPLLNFFFFFAT